MITKGPWFVKEVKTQVGRAFKINEPEKIDEPHGIIACIYDDDTLLNNRPHEEHEANAHLIAAAPELLGACKAALNAFTTNTDLFGVVDTLKSAIAKAEQK
jgi:hypothetical protein